MKPREERIKEHPSVARADELNALLDAFDEGDWSTDIREELHRIRRVVGHFSQRMAVVDPELTSIQALKAIDQHLLKAQQELTQFKANKNINHLANANSAADTILAQSAALWVPVVDFDLELVRDAIGSFRKSVGQNARYAEQELNNTRDVIQNIRHEADDIKDTLKEQKSRIDSVVSELQSQFSSSEETRRKEAAAALKSREEQFGELQTAYEEKFDASVSTAEGKLAEISKETEERANNSIESLTELKDKAERLVHVIANTGMVGGYQRVADEERRVARLWDGTALLSLVGMIVFAISAFREVLGEFNTGILLARFSVIITFAALAGYAARQAEKHHKVERRNRRVELELASIGPFLAELPEEERNQIKAAVADRLFARELGMGADLGRTLKATADGSESEKH